MTSEKLLQAFKECMDIAENDPRLKTQQDHDDALKGMLKGIYNNGIQTAVEEIYTFRYKEGFNKYEVDIISDAVDELKIK